MLQILTTCQRTTLYWLLLIVNRIVQCSEELKNGEVKLKLKLNVNFTLEQTTKAQRGNRGIALFFI
jgi:hypothetical protein